MTGPAVDPSLIGSWQLVAIGDDNAGRDEDVEGSLVVNVSHLSLYIARGIGSGRPELRSVVRRYTIAGERLRMTTDHGHGIRKGDEVLLEQGGDVITLKMVWLQDGSLRLHEPQGTYLEFTPLLR